VLFKAFADIDLFDIELNLTDPAKIIEVVQALEPTFGGVNLEYIKAPECFEIENALKRSMNIPVFHDDQHGTAVISGAGLINALEITQRRIEDTIIVITGAGAAGIACATFYVSMGVDPANIRMFDSKGILHKGRKNLDAHKARFAGDKELSLAEALSGAHMFLGLSRKGILSQDMVRGMAKSPVLFACANPDPEISVSDAKAARPDCIMGTGRSDYPNQVNNVSGFPYIFRGALDVGAREINEAMKLAAARSLAALAKEPVPEEVCAAYKVKKLEFGPDYIIPKPLDPRLIEWETPAVAKAAMETGVATRPIADLKAYATDLRARIKACRARMRDLVDGYSHCN
jgi:malate dehydrogenase (oxaloacetate-decarboxylating)(NADP+)